MIHVVVADPYPVTREGVKRIVEGCSGMAVVGGVSGARALFDLLSCVEADVLVLEPSLPGSDLVSLFGRLGTRHPTLATVVLAGSSRPDLALRGLTLGASACVTKRAAPSTIVEAVRRAARGEEYLSGELAAGVARRRGRRLPHEALSPREYQVLELGASGLRSGEIAERLSLSPKTVSTYRRRILRKLDLDSFPAAIRYAVENGIVGDRPA